jgi:hypothetical protein
VIAEDLYLYNISNAGLLCFGPQDNWLSWYADPVTSSTQWMIDLKTPAN